MNFICKSEIQAGTGSGCLRAGSVLAENAKVGG